MKTIYGLLLVASLLTACGQGGGSSQGQTGSKALFSLWTNTENASQLDYSGKRIGWTQGFSNLGCDYELRVEAVPGNTNAFTDKTVDVTSPANPGCFDYSSQDVICELRDGRRLECCLINGDPNDPNTCYDYN